MTIGFALPAHGSPTRARPVRRRLTAFAVPVASLALLLPAQAPAGAAAAPAAPAAAPAAVAAAPVPAYAFAPTLRPGTKRFGKRVLKVAAAQRGKPYRWGATGPRAFDCSGFVQYVYKRAGVKLPRTSSQMRGATRRISKSQVRKGDLVFVARYGRVSHVAIYAGKGQWYESSRPGKPVRKNAAWAKRGVSYGRAR